MVSGAGQSARLGRGRGVVEVKRGGGTSVFLRLSYNNKQNKPEAEYQTKYKHQKTRKSTLASYEHGTRELGNTTPGQCVLSDQNIRCSWSNRPLKWSLHHVMQARVSKKHPTWFLPLQLTRKDN